MVFSLDFINSLFTFCFDLKNPKNMILNRNFKRKTKFGDGKMFYLMSESLLTNDGCFERMS